MQNDKTTLHDLSVFTADAGGGIFGLIDRTATQAGRDMLRRHIQSPPESYDKLCQVQAAIGFWMQRLHLWPTQVLNGTIVMLDSFFESADNIATPPSGLSLLLGSFFQKLLNRRQYFFTQFSLSHLSDFLKGCVQLTAMLDVPGLPPLLQRELETIREELKHPLTASLLAVTKDASYSDLTRLSYKARRDMKSMVYRLISSYARLDAWQGMARATLEHGWALPQLLPALPVCLEAQGLYHPLLSTPVAYDIAFNRQANFLVLTGANMSGKTTFMRALGVGALLAHLGMGVPAAGLRISFLQGIITNMQVEDNILRGESYFYAEVQRMKNTAEKLVRREPHLVLMDELFKGTNVHDAYECTKAVMEGLLHHPAHLMVLSTHLYEVAQQFSSNPSIHFSYFVTNMGEGGAYQFTYRLHPGISNDRIGYRILQQEGVIALLHSKEEA